MKRAELPAFCEARGKHLLIALSGGADSVALACLLAECREALSLTLSAAHIDHCIRGEESREDALFCRELCERLNIPFYMEMIDVPAAAEASGEGLETAARRLRYDALRNIRQSVGAEFIATAHHLNDQAETVLMHLLRGCGPEGISGMEILHGDLYRPLLHTPRKTIEAYLTGQGISWRTDSTNFDAFTPRNALRLHGLPALEESYPQAAQAIARYAEAAQVENRFMDRLAREFLENHLESGAYGRRILRPEEADEAILRRCIRMVCGRMLSHDRLTETAALIRAKRGRVDISQATFVERTPGALYFLPKNPVLPPELPVPESGELFWPSIGRLTAVPGSAIPVRDNPLKQVLRADVLQGAILRTRRDGDRIRPLGCGEKLLSDYFTDRKIDRPLRNTVPLVAQGSRILWAVGVGISQEAALQSNLDQALQLEWIYEPEFKTLRQKNIMEGTNHEK